ncbi:hypothetical protein NLJ89_g1222 [Agrocybe chaxingu]|uniref:Hydrophobin n=1 Tax=Agrocybe chaxingu TaxID=84603 RepID=A0A9W8N0I4_9AGAR|nr:hypothetical protein NLJ89_g1222 [Agrocybe chaxingu]
MQFKLSTLATVALPALVAATPTRRAECTTGSVQCCDSVQSASDPSVATLLGLLGIVVQDVTAQVGLTCTPITVIGGAGNSCSAQTVCCENNNYASGLDVNRVFAPAARALRSAESPREEGLNAVSPIPPVDWALRIRNPTTGCRLLLPAAATKLFWLSAYATILSQTLAS